MNAKDEFLKHIRNKSKVICSTITHYKEINYLRQPVYLNLTTGWDDDQADQDLEWDKIKNETIED